MGINANLSIKIRAVGVKSIANDMRVLDNEVSNTAFLPATTLLPMISPVTGSIISIPFYISVVLIHHVLRKPATAHAIVDDMEFKNRSLVPVNVLVLFSTAFLIPKATKHDELVAIM